MTMTHTSLLVLLICLILSFVSSQTIIDAPPSIIFPANLDDPKNLVIIGNVSNLHNSLTCTARNADSVDWSYLSDPFQTTLNSIPSGEWNRKDSIRDRVTGDLSRTITDAGITDLRKRDQQNGYYKCTARTNVNGNNYAASSPPIRFIFPSVYTNGFPDPLDSTVVEEQTHSLRCLDDSKVVIEPADLLDLNILKFMWFYKSGSNVEPVVESSRIKINPKNGDLYFAYITQADHTGQLDTDAEYQCRMIVLDKPIETIASRHRLQVIARSDAETKPEFQLSYPTSIKAKKVTCIEGTQCLLSCIFVGRDWSLGKERDPPNPNFEPPSNTFVATYEGITAKFTGIDDAEGTWKCGIDDIQQKGEIEVDILNYPSIPAGNMLDQFVEVGTDVVFECNPSYVAIDRHFFYVNGEIVRQGVDGAPARPPHVQYSSDGTSIKMMNVQRDNSAMVSCTAFNKAGIKFKAAQLNVYEAPNITLTPAGGYAIKDNVTDSLEFTCTALLDEKVASASIHWRTNHTEKALRDMRITGKHDFGVKSVRTSEYSPITREIKSDLAFNVDIDTQDKIFGGHWWCVVEFSIPGKSDPIVAMSQEEPFITFIPNKKAVIAAAGFADWWIIGVVVALFFILLIIVLIICCVKHHKGEQYYVDEKERKAGHNPEEEMGNYGFSDYKRPDQDPIKGSRTSLDMSDQPLQSEGGSMDEYGDIDPGRFNEDGSFIGEYGKSSTNIEV